MNGENMHEDLRKSFEKQMNALISLIKKLLDIWSDEKRTSEELGMLKEDLSKLEEIKKKLKDLNITEETSFKDAVELLGQEDKDTINRIFGCYSTLVVDTEYLSDVSDNLKREGIPHTCTNVRLNEKSNKMQSVILFCTGPDRDVEKMAQWDHVISAMTRGKNFENTKEKEGFGILSKEKFEKAYKGRSNFVKIPDVNLTTLELAKEYLIKSGKAVGYERGSERTTRNVFVREEDYGYVMAQLAFAGTFTDTVYGKYKTNQLNAEGMNIIHIKQAALDITNTSYICNGSNDYIKITPSGLDFYQDGVLIPNRHVSRTESSEKFVKEALRLSKQLQIEDVVVMNESQFTPDKEKRRVLHQSMSKNIELSVNDDYEGLFIKRIYELRQPLNELLSKANNINYKAMLDKDLGLNRVVGMQLRAAIYKQLNDNYKITEAAINNRPDFKYEIPSIEEIGEYADTALEDADAATTEFLNTVLKETSDSEKAEIKNKLMKLFDNSLLGADFEQTLKLAQSLEKSLEETSREIEETQKLGPTLEQIIEKNNDYRDSRDNSKEIEEEVK